MLRKKEGTGKKVAFDPLPLTVLAACCPRWCAGEYRTVHCLRCILERDEVSWTTSSKGWPRGSSIQLSSASLSW